jgi:hypothetical protein
MAAGALVHDETCDGGAGGAQGSPPPQPRPRLVATKAGKWPASLHACTLLASLAFWSWTDRALWFFGDEWDFLVRRGLSFPPGSPRSIWYPHNEHWSTLPILLWRALYSIFHLNSYWPYLAPLLLAGTVVAHLSWRLALRAGADPWVATFAAGLLAFLGAGASDMTSAFQVTFVGSVLFGLLSMLLLDPATPPKGRTDFRARDAIASLSLLGALMCSTVGDAMVAGTALLLFARRPWRRALAVLALPVLSYAIWFAFLGRPSISAPRAHFGLRTFTTLPSYVLFGLAGAIGQSADDTKAGVVVLTCLAAWAAWQLRSLWQHSPGILGLCAAAVAFYVMAAAGRDQTAGAFTVVSRYVWVAMAILVPVIAKALSPRSFGAGGPAFRVPVCALLTAATLGNLGQASRWATAQAGERTTLEHQLVAVGRLLGAGVHDVSGPPTSPIQLYPALAVASIEHLEHAHLLPAGEPRPLVTSQARELLALGTWDGTKTSLTARRLYPGSFTLLRAMSAVVSPAGAGCISFAPKFPLPRVQIWLMAPRSGGASLELAAPPASQGLTNFVAATLLPTSGRAPAPVELAVPVSGRGYLSDNAAATLVELSWRVGTPLLACGLRAPGRDSHQLGTSQRP